MAAALGLGLVVGLLSEDDSCHTCPLNMTATDKGIFTVLVGAPFAAILGNVMSDNSDWVNISQTVPAKRLGVFLTPGRFGVRVRF